MRLLAYGGAGLLVVMVAYACIGLVIYDFDQPEYDMEGDGEVSIDIYEFEGVSFMTEVSTWRFNGYEPGSVIPWLHYLGLDHSRIYNRIEPAFRPLTWIVRRIKGHAYRGQWHADTSSDPGWHGCSRSRRWVTLEP